jgi:transcription initiation factor TFIID subunit 13
VISNDVRWKYELDNTSRSTKYWLWNFRRREQNKIISQTEDLSPILHHFLLLVSHHLPPPSLLLLPLPLFDVGDLVASPVEKKAKMERKSVDVKLTKNIEEMMFGFGDEWPCDREAVDLVDNLVQNYISDLVIRAQKVALQTGKLDKECFVYLVRQETMKFKRINNLLKANEEIHSVQKVDIKEQD